MVDVGKREDRLLDTLSEYLAIIDLARMQIEIYRSTGRTEGEIEILNTLDKLLTTTKKGAANG